MTLWSKAQQRRLGWYEGHVGLPPRPALPVGHRGPERPRCLVLAHRVAAEDVGQGLPVVGQWARPDGLQPGEPDSPKGNWRRNWRTRLSCR